MKAFAITARDSQPALQDLPQPQPAAGEVLVEVEAASVNGFDLSVAAGYVWDMLPHEFPVVLGRDLVGTVTAAGDGVDNVEAGDRVAGVIPGVALGPRTGSFAEQVSLPAWAVTRIRSGVGAHDAAVIGLAGIAAHDALEALDVQRGETVLISGATGGVGSIALQLAAAAGATVIATARPPGRRRRSTSAGLGAAHTVDYPTASPPQCGRSRRTVPTRRCTPPRRRRHRQGHARRRRRSVHARRDRRAAPGDDVTVTGIMAAATAGKLARLLNHVASGNLRVNIEARVPLDRTHEALKTFTDGTLGKVLHYPLTAAGARRPPPARASSCQEMYMKVTVFGATGGIGSQVVGQLRSRGHTVTAYVRNPGKVPGTWDQDVAVVVGELSDAAAIDRAVQGANAVVSALGPSLSRTAAGLPLIKGTRNIVAAMQRHGVRRYVGNGTPQRPGPARAADLADPAVGLHGQDVPAPRLRRTHRHQPDRDDVRAGLDDRALPRAEGRARARATEQLFYGHDQLGFGITRADIAAFTAAQVDDARYIGAAPAISN